MKTLVLNVGSGGQKCSLFVTPDGELPADPIDPVWEAKVDTTDPDQPPGKLRVQVRHGGGEKTGAGELEATSSIEERTRALFERLWSGDDAPVRSLAEIDIVAHRVVHGGAEFDRAVVLDERVEAAIQRLARWAPLHNPPSLVGIRLARETFSSATHCAVFDTAFHRTLPEVARVYPGPHAWIEKGIQRYGFHGTSFRWAGERAAHLMGRSKDPDLALILAHIGGGCSLCATRGGRSLDTTMGFTPLDGIAMCTRSGAVDPGILIHLLREGMSVDDLEKALNRESGLKGLSELSGDTRVLRPQIQAGNRHATLAWDVFIHRLRAGIGAMVASLGRAPDAFVFTDVIGESEPALRTGACAPFSYLGLELDEAANAAAKPDSDVATPESRVRVLLIRSGEAWQIVRECHALTANGPCTP